MDKVSCKQCKMPMSRYAIQQNEKTYKIKLCWKCGFFSIYPKIHDEFTDAIISDKTLILELIEKKLLKPIL